MLKARTYHCFCSTLILREEVLITRKQRKKYIEPTIFYDEAGRRYEEIKKMIRRLEESLKKAPDGKINIRKCNGTTQFYLRENPSDKTGKYLPKGEQAIIKKYIQKSYNEKALKILKNELKILESVIANSYNSKASIYQFSEQIQQLFSNVSADVKQFINPIDISDKDYADAWLSVEYEGKQVDDDMACFETDNGEKVRSKSELTIANTLYRKGIPYRYEYPLILKNGIRIHPDFTVLNVKQRKEIIWEHRGMMDDEGYARNAVDRNKLYMLNGFHLGINLVITEETSVKPLGTDEIKDVIDNYF